MKLPKLTRKPKTLNVSEDVSAAEEITKKSKRRWCRKCKFPKVPERLIPVLTGIVITISSYLIVVAPMNLSVEESLGVSVLIAFVLTVILTRSKSFRCLVCLILAQMCSKRGRTVIVAYTYVLIMTGPSVNITKNIYETARTMSCGQEQLQRVMGGIIKIMKSPFMSLKAAFKDALKVIKEVLIKVKLILVDIYKSCKEVLKAVGKAFAWLGSIVNICNKKVGTPYQRCTGLFDKAELDCLEQSRWYRHFCWMTKIVRFFCNAVRFLDLVCEIMEFISDKIVGEVERKLKRFMSEIKQMLEVSVTFEHNFDFQTNSSKSFGNITADILGEITERTSKVTRFFGVLDIFSSVFVIWMYLKAMFYKYKYLSNDRFDNYYITQDVRDLDEQRIKLDKDAVLPLTRMEASKFIELTSWKLVKPEKKKIAKTGIFLFVTNVQMGSIILADYFLYWLLDLINRFGSHMKEPEVPFSVSISVVGEGMIADIYAGIIKAFEPMNTKFDLKWDSCLPQPHIPNYKRYINIGICIVLCWCSVLVEPYALRVRQVIMRRHYPDRAKERAAWLVNHILRHRKNFVKLARRDMRRKYKKDTVEKDAEEPILHRLKKFIFCFRCFGVCTKCCEFIKTKIIRRIFKEKKKLFCMLCAKILKEDADVVSCTRPGCIGRYCAECYADLKNTCSLCMEPLEYDDISDVSEEIDSSDDPDSFKNLQKQKKGRKKKARKHEDVEKQ